MAKYCTNCGKELNENQDVCLNCGIATKKINTHNPGTKSKLASGLLGIFLGSLGVHNFYLGYTGKAVAQLLITVLSCGALSVVSGVWGLIEGIMILAGSITIDAEGKPLGE